MSENTTHPVILPEAVTAALLAAPVEIAPARLTQPKRRRTRKPATSSQRAPQAASSRTTPENSLARTLGGCVDFVKRTWLWLKERRQWQAHPRRMRLCETVSLGEKRFLAIVKVDGEQFLIGGAAGSVSLLTPIANPEGFAGVLRKRRRSARTSA